MRDFAHDLYHDVKHAWLTYPMGFGWLAGTVVMVGIVIYEAFFQ